MTKLDKVLERLDVHLKHIIPATIETSNRIEDENRVLRKEIIRLEEIQKQLIQILSEKMLKNKDEKKK